MNSARFAYSWESFSTASVTGPQNRLMQYSGVAKTTSAGRCSAMASAIVHSWRFRSGIEPSMEARESIAARGTPFEWMVRFSVRRAGWPGAGSAGAACTRNAFRAIWVPDPAISAVTRTNHTPGASNVTFSASYTPRAVSVIVGPEPVPGGVPGVGM